MTLNGRRVVSTGRRIGRFTFGYGRKEPYEAMLADGICTHDEIRQVLLAALRSDAIRPVVGEYLKDAARSVIIDEVFDGNRLDLAIVLLAVDAHISTTLIGDPWQALYEFRGAEPALVPAVIAGRGFTTLPVTQSFRFRTALTRDIAHALRDGRSVKVPKGTADTSDVVLAALWEPLWGLSDAVLPLSFGQIGNRTDAAISLLLDRLVASRLGDEMAPGLESALILGLDPQVLRSDAAAALAPVYERLSGGSYADAESGLTLLRSTLREMGSLNITRLQSAQEQRRVNRLLALSRRMARDQLVPGMTIHQAKGREWPRVGVHLSAAQLSRLDAGLSSDDQGDRAVYVALTRAQDTIQLL